MKNRRSKAPSEEEKLADEDERDGKVTVVVPSEDLFSGVDMSTPQGMKSVLPVILKKAREMGINISDDDRYKS